MTRCLFIVICLLFVGVITVRAQSGGDYEIKRHVIASGGGEVSGGDYTLNGTVGQHAAQTISGGDYVLYGGFWQPNRSVPTSVGRAVGSAETSPPTLYIILLLTLLGTLAITQLNRQKADHDPHQ